LEALFMGGHVLQPEGIQVQQGAEDDVSDGLNTCAALSDIVPDAVEPEVWFNGVMADVIHFRPQGLEVEAGKVYHCRNIISLLPFFLSFSLS
jgi:hypothetical protein